MYYRVNALAGAGKTYTAIRWATKFAHHTGQKFLIVQPSKNLIDESYADCLRVVGEIGARIKVIRMYGEHEGDPVTTRIVNHLKTTPAGGEILFITQAAFFKCPYFHNRENWTLIVDEIPQVDKHWDFKLPRTHTLLTDALEVTDHDPLHYLVTTKDEARLKHFRRNPDRDQIYAMFSEVADCVLSPDWSVYVRKEHWERYRYAETDGGRHTLAMFAMLDPSIFSGFRATIVMGAMFEESLMSLYWASKGIQFESRLSIENNVRYHQHDNGGLITFKYVLEEDWSKRLRDIAIDDQSLMDVVIDAINGEFHGQEFLWVANNDIDRNPFPNGIRLPRGIANITYVNGVWFDNDGGDLDPDEFHRLFPDLRLVVFNTFSGGNRWRAFIPTKQVMTVEAHQIIVRTFDTALRGGGYYSNKDAAKLEQRTGGSVKRHGFDTSKFTASSLFYLPCIAKDGTSFFQDWAGKEIDPIQWVERAVVHDRAEPCVILQFEDEKKTRLAANTNEVPTWTGVDDCPFINRKRLDQYRATLPHTDERYTGLFSMAASIIKGANRFSYHLSQTELERLLIEIDNSMGGYHQGLGHNRIRDCAKNALKKVA